MGEQVLRCASATDGLRHVFGHMLAEPPELTRAMRSSAISQRHANTSLRSQASLVKNEAPRATRAGERDALIRLLDAVGGRRERGSDRSAPVARASSS